MLGLYVFSVVALIIWGYFLTKKKMNPVTIYNMIWLVAILLYQLKISGLQQELDDATYWLFIMKSAVFTAGFSVFYKLRLNKRQKNAAKKETRRQKSIAFSENNYKKLLIPVFAIWCFVEIVETIYSGGLPIVWKLIGDPRTYSDYGISTVHGLMNAVGLVIISLSTMLYLKSKDRKQKLGYVGIILVCLGFYLSVITRQVIVSAVIQMFVIYLLMRKPYKKKSFYLKLIALIVAGVAAFGIVGNFRTGYENFLNVAEINNEVGSSQSSMAGFYWVYMYLTMSIANINNAVVLDVNNFGGLYPVARTFLPTVISKAIFPTDTAIKIPNYLVTPAFTVSGYFIDFYVGLGALGVAIIAALYGILGGLIYNAIQKKMNDRNILLYAVYVQIILLSFFYNHLLYLPSGFQLVIILVFYYFLTRNKDRHETS